MLQIQSDPLLTSAHFTQKFPMIAVDRQGILTASHSTPVAERDQLILDRARSVLRGYAYSSLRRLDCSVENGVLTVRGVLPSFYLKQVVQEALLSDSSCQVRNLVTVLWP